ncbi:hypothetical protein HYV70_04380 [Candidatus Uhrbacteria bacterium]|nr:hypothetical protein [Candidatus Uhrbacteria bacterium]
MKKKFLLFLLFLMTACCPCKDVQKNVFEQPVEVQLAYLHSANDQENWKIPEETFAHLAQTAPAWPEGRLAFRSFRIRFGEGNEGVEKTFEAHVQRIQNVMGEKFQRWDYRLFEKVPFQDEPVERLRLLNGNTSHHAVVEWIIIDLDANRQRKSITAVRGPTSLADELFVFIWLFQDYVQNINYDENPGLFAGGYEFNIPERDGGPWQNVPCVLRYLSDGATILDAHWRSNDNSGYSVPLLRE